MRWNTLLIQTAPNLTTYYDSNWVSSIGDRRSTTGFNIYLGFSPYLGTAKKRPIVYHTTINFEYKDLSIISCNMWIIFKGKEISKHFLWRLITNNVSTNSNLYRKKVCDDTKCPLCTHDDETMIHMLWNYQAANDVWTDSNLPTKKWQRFLEEFGQFLEIFNLRFDHYALALAVSLYEACG